MFSGEETDLFTGALYNNYQAPAGFCFDVLCADAPIIDGKHSPDNNVKERVRFYIIIGCFIRSLVLCFMALV